MELTPEMLGWIASFLTDAGALLLSLNIKRSNWGFLVFLVGNIFWVIVGLLTANAPLATNQLFLMGTSAVGVWRWIITRNPVTNSA